MERYKAEFIEETRAGDVYWIWDTDIGAYLDRMFEDEESAQAFAKEMNTKNNGG